MPNNLTLMATYKVLQDIEAEDKLLGPLSLRQFIYAIITVVLGFIAFQILIRSWFLALPLFPPMILFAVLSAPFGHDQSSEIWLLAKIRFFLKPHKRIWDQSGISQLVTITAPKIIDHHYTKNLSKTEVRSRLSALANTIDSRGWAIKNVNVNLSAQPVAEVIQSTDRLIDPAALPQEVPNYDISAADDIMDEKSNPTAQMFDQMITASSNAHRQQLVDQTQGKQPVQGPAGNQPQPDYWFLNQPGSMGAAIPNGYATFDHSALVSPGQNVPVLPSPTVTADDQNLLANIQAYKNITNPMHSRLKTIQPLDPALNSSAKNPPSTEPPKLTATPNPAILDLANNDDLNVATIARQAGKSIKQPPDDEVVVSLH